MSEATPDSFPDALADHGVTTTQTSSAALPTAIDAAIDPPAVATPLSDDVDLSTIDGLALNPSPAAIRDAETGVTPATLGIAASGSVILESDGTGVEPVSLYPPKHVAIIHADAIVPDMAHALTELEAIFESGGDAVIATGPSATADMGELVVGAHGPRDVHVIIVEAQS